MSAQRSPAVTAALAIGGLGVVLTLARLVVCLPNLSFVLSESGMWGTLARDFRDGVFYRPLDSALGFGGTRYFPLAFILHGLLMKAGLPVVAAGHVVGVGSILALVLGAYVLMRRLEVRRQIALAGSLLLLLTVPVQLAVCRIAGDGLPAALNVWALALCVPVERVNTRRLMLAGLLFVLAFSAKLSTVFGLGAACAVLFMARRRKEALALGALCALGMVGCLLLFQWASEGRFLENMRIIQAQSAPMSSLARGPEMFLARQQWELPLFLLALWGLWAQHRRGQSAFQALPFWLLVFTALVTCVIFTSPGTETNHLMDTSAAVMVALAVALERNVLRPWAAAGTFVLSSGGSLLMMAAFGFSSFGSPLDQRALATQLLQRAGEPGTPLLAQTSWLSLVNDEPVAMMDTWNFILVSKGRPQVLTQLKEQIRKKAYRAIILNQPLGQTAETPDEAHPTEGFGEGVNAEISASYRLEGEVGGRFLWLPRTTVGSSRVDLQACKLEYSIVSPK